MKYLAFDTETTGLFSFKKPADAEGQPRLASFAAILTNEEAEEEHRIDDCVSPSGWSMTDPDKKKASEINGLTDEYLMENGVPVEAILTQYSDLINNGYIPVAFNAQFDTKVMRAELRRAGMDDMFKTTPNVCVMNGIAEIMFDAGVHNSAKRVSLAKACEFIGYINENAHTALDDTLAVVAIMRYLIPRGAMPLPEVHFAKNHESTGGVTASIVDVDTGSTTASGKYDF